MKIHEEGLGRTMKFESGDLVSWTTLDERYTGVLVGISSRTVGGRKVKNALVFCFETKQNEKVLAINLKRVPKNDEEVLEN